MEQVTANLGKTRRVEVNGREYLVAPLTLIVPGVLNGSKGPLYYPPEEVSHDPAAWNGMPIVVYHPLSNGAHVSARDPDVLGRQEIGRVFRANGNGKLTAEGWFDVEATRRVDKRVLQSLEAGRPIELSTGLYTDNEDAPANATHNGKPYSFVARNYRPDHLAILPDQVGACSVRDGCGVMVNEDKTVNTADQPHSKNTGKFKRVGAGTGRGEAHEAAQRGAIKLTADDAAKGAEARAEADAGNNPPSWVDDEAAWDRAKSLADKGDYDADSYWAVVAHIYGNIMGNQAMFTDNAFCPTGEGGGVDPSCSPGGGGGTEDRYNKELKEGSGITARTTDQELRAKSEDELRAFVSMPGNRLTAGWTHENLLKSAISIVAGSRARLKLESDVAKSIGEKDPVKVREYLMSGRFDKLKDIGKHQNPEAVQRDYRKFGRSQVKGGYWDSFAGNRYLSKIAEERSTDRNRDMSTDNAFCPTGEGGGIDPSCSPGGEGSSEGSRGSTGDEKFQWEHYDSPKVAASAATKAAGEATPRALKQRGLLEASFANSSAAAIHASAAEMHSKAGNVEKAQYHQGMSDKHRDAAQQLSAEFHSRAFKPPTELESAARKAMDVKIETEQKRGTYSKAAKAAKAAYYEVQHKIEAQRETHSVKIISQVHKSVGLTANWNGRSGPSENLSQGNEGEPDMAMKPEARKKIVDDLIANCGGCGWKEADRETLNDLGDETLLALDKHRGEVAANAAAVKASRDALKVPAEVTVNAMPAFIQKAIDAKKEKAADGDCENMEGEEKKACEEEMATKNAATKNAERKGRMMTDKEWLTSAPPTIRSAVQNAIAIENRERGELIGKITENVADENRERVVNRLRGKPLDELRDLLALAPPEKEEERRPFLPSYLGAAASVRNSGKDMQAEDVLSLPTVNWGEVAEQRRRAKN